MVILVEDDDEDEEQFQDPFLEGDPEQSEQAAREPDNVSAKTEPSSDGEGDSNHSNIDPMGLLERIDMVETADSQDEEDDFSMDESGNEKSLVTRRKMPRAERWLLWMKRWPWLLHEFTDDPYAFCLYCNMNINVNNRSRHIHQHNMSMYHRERESNYLAFKEEQEPRTSSDAEVKYEFGTQSYVVDMKQRRSSEIEAFNNFNWTRWLRWHPWLEREKPSGTIGRCRACNVRMNVEFVYLRRRHETSKGHLEAQRMMDSDKPSRKRKRSKSVNEAMAEAAAEEPQKADEGENTAVVVMNGEVKASEDPSRWCELIPETNPQLCRCTICNYEMAITSYLRHCKSNLHCQKLADFLNRHMRRDIWAIYADPHPWLVADPEDPTVAYCSVCCKRFWYGHSELKRKAHEKGEKHLSALEARRRKQRLIEEAQAMDEEKEEKEEDDDEAPAQGEAASDNEASEEEEDNVSDENWSTINGTAKASVGEKGKAKQRPGLPFYPWLCYSKDRKVQWCKHCSVSLNSERAKVRHELSAGHRKLVRQYKPQQSHKSALQKQQEQEQEDEEEEPQELEEEEDEDRVQQAAKGTRSSPSKPQGKPIPATIKGKVMVWKGRFPWLSYKRSEERRNYGWCKLCEVSVFLPTSKFASKHQRSSRHIRLRIERKRQAVTGPTPTMTTRNGEGISAAVATAAALVTGEAKQKAAMAELQAKYSWLDPDPNDENHCHCRICVARLPIKLFYLRQHDASRKHCENVERLAASKPDAAAAPSVSNVSEATGEVQESGLEVDRESEADLSLSRSDGSAGEPPVKRSRRSMETRRILRALRDSYMRSGRDERSQLDVAKDMICSSFDIVARLRTLEREGAGQGQFSAQAPQSSDRPAPQPQPPTERHVMDLFFDSILPTMKALPTDLAAEGKSKIMQLVCSLELRALQRTDPASTSPKTQPTAATAAPAGATPVKISPKPAPPANDPQSTVITICDDGKEPKSAPQHVTLNGNHNGLPENIRRMLSNTSVQLTKRLETEPVRCVPLNKLTSQIRNGRMSISGAIETGKTAVVDPNRQAMLRQSRLSNSGDLRAPKTFIQQPQQQASPILHNNLVNGTPLTFRRP
ncbi:hypothetical protein KR018_005921 [Drosophila ironensis]|nr:hypothetical protein KR018_005921 [Drosophila ironensis]